MFELPEVVTLARQINETLTGKIIRTGKVPRARDKVKGTGKWQMSSRALTAFRLPHPLTEPSII